MQPIPYFLTKDLYPLRKYKTNKLVYLENTFLHVASVLVIFGMTFLLSSNQHINSYLTQT